MSSYPLASEPLEETCAMIRRPHAPRSTRYDYTPDIDQLAALLLRWQGVASTPPSLTEAVEELSTPWKSCTR